MENKNRWFIAIAAILTHLFLGTVYAWSFFQKPVSEAYGWTQGETAWAFSISNLMMGVTSAWCGAKLHQFKLKNLATMGAVLYGLGYIVSYFALKLEILPLLYIGFGFIGGIGLGMAYVTPVVAVSSWFPDKQGLATGMVVTGFGLGALIMSKILAPFFLNLFEENLAVTFLAIGCMLLIVLPIFTYQLSIKNTTSQNTTEISFSAIYKTIIQREYIASWLFFMFSVIAGMIFIAFQSPLLQDYLRAEGMTDATELEQHGATLIGVSSLCNGFGRFMWGGVSDKVGRIQTFRMIFLIEICIFIVLIFTQNPIVFFLGVCLVLLCYGGSLGVMPSLVKEQYNPNLMASLYGIMMVGWGIGGLIGPQITAYMKDYFQEQAGVYSYIIGLVLLCLGFLLTLFVKKKPKDI